MNPELGHIDVTELKKVETLAIQSMVIKESNLNDELNDDQFNLGHIPMFDFEDVTIDQVHDVIDEYLDFAFIFRSSENSYHVYSTEIISLQELVELKDQIELDDDDHNVIGLEKGCMALRLTDKGDKPRPSFVEFYQSWDCNLKEVTHSYPHLTALADLHEIDKAYTMLDNCKTVGDKTRVVVYETYENNHDVDDLMSGKEVVERRSGDSDGF